jgi:sec-independent protein translocase protein TatC
VLLFLFGAAVSFFAVLPRVFELLDNERPFGIRFRAASFLLPMYVHVPLVLGSVFELLGIMYMLAFLGIVSPRQMSASRRYAVVLALLSATLFTPWPFRLDMFVVVTGLIYALYEVGIIFAKIAGRRRNRQRTLGDEGISALAG